MNTVAQAHRRLAGRLTPLLLIAIVALWPPVAVAAQAEEDDASEPRLTLRHGDLVSVFSGDIHVPAGVVQRGNVVCIGGDVVIDGDVNGDLVAILGSLKLDDSSVRGQVTGVLSDVELRNTEVDGAVVSVGGALELENSTVSREMVNVLGSLDRDELSRAAGQIVNVGFTSFWTLLFWVRLFHKFVIFVLIFGLLLIVPERIRLMADEAPVRYVPAFFVGLLVYLVFWLLLPLLAFTIVGVPVLLFAFWIVKWMGIAAIFHAIGRRLGRVAGLELSLLGSVLIVFAVYVVAFLLPTPLGLLGLVVVAIVRTLFFLLLEAPAVGLVVLTRVGDRRSSVDVLPSPVVRPDPAQPRPPAPPPAPTS